MTGPIFTLLRGRYCASSYSHGDPGPVSEVGAPQEETPEQMRRRTLVGATSLAVLGEVVQGLAEAHEVCAPRDAFAQAGMELAITGIQLDLGQLDTAEPFAASAVRTYGQAHHRGRIQAELALADVHVRTGDPRGVVLAQRAIEAVGTLQSVAVRRERLVPLVATSEARPGSHAKELARTARQVAATQM